MVSKAQKIDWLLLIFLFSFTLPSYLYAMESAMYIAAGFAGIAFLYSSFIFVKRGKISIVLVSIIALHLCYLYSTIIHADTSLSRWFIISMPVIATITFLEISCMQRSMLKFLYTTLILLTIYNILNLLSILVYPNGLYDARGIGEFGITAFGNMTTAYYFLGYQKGHIFFQLSACGFSLLFELLTKKNIDSYFYLNLVISIISSIVMMSVSGTIVLLIVGFLLLKCMYKIFHMVSLLRIIGLVFLVWVSIVVLRIQEFFTNILGLVGKDLTLTGRTIVWDVGIEKFLENPLTGLGIISSERAYDLFHFGVGSVHSLFLEVLFYGGVLAGSCFMLLLLIIIYNSNLLDKSNMKVSYGLKVIISAFLVLFLFNSGQQKTFLYLFMVLPCYLNNFLKNEAAYNKNE